MKRKRKKHSLETKQKISNSLKGHIIYKSKKRSENISNSKKGKPSWNKGKKMDRIFREKISKTLKGLTGEKSRNWKGGLNPMWVRKQRIKQNGGSHTLGDWETLKAQYNWTCLYCKNKEPKIILTKDHVIPISKGGSDNIENIQPLCRSCNSKKHTHINDIYTI